MENAFFVWMTAPISYDWAALLIRLAIGLSLLPYAYVKFTELRKPPEFPRVLGLSSRTGFYIAFCAEAFTSLGCIFGFCTRLAALVGAGNMAVATYTVHGKYWTANAMPYCLGLIAILFIGAGKFSLDYLLR